VEKREDELSRMYDTKGKYLELNQTKQNRKCHTCGFDEVPREVPLFLRNCGLNCIEILQAQEKYRN
jgi:hypothetical protein